jgi:molybdopterin-guanine dinucleotide biosynthesis protein A
MATFGETERREIVGLLLAGGQSRRMGGGDKSLRMLAGQSILARVIARAQPQVGQLLLNANGDPLRFQAFSLPVLPDVVPDYAGPLAGILTGLTWMRDNRPEATHLASFACDAPFFPEDLIARLWQEMIASNAQLVWASSQGRAHPVFGLWPVALADDLDKAVRDEGLRKVDLWTGRYRFTSVDFPLRGHAGTTIDPFFNANRPEDFEVAERLLAH